MAKSGREGPVKFDPYKREGGGGQKKGLAMLKGGGHKHVLR